jgi:hypothetical protein
MLVLRRLLRSLGEARFRILGLAVIKDIPTDRFNRLIDKLIGVGWHKTGEYDGVDAWIDYGRITLTKDEVKLTLEWDNWTEGSLEGPQLVIEELGREFELPVSHRWRWSDYDSAHR